MHYRIGPFEPDRPIVRERDDVGRIAVREADYVLPTLDGYRPVRVPVQRGAFGTLNSACRGARGVRTSDGTTYLVLGTATKLYLTSGGAVVDRTGASVPALTSTERWDFETYDTGVLAASLSVPIQRSTGAAFADLSADAPRANRLMVLDQFVVAADFIGRGANAGLGTRRDGVHWCARGDETSWPATGTDAALAVQSDWQPLQGESGPVTLLLATGTYGLVCRERAVHRMDYAGGAEIMQFEPVEKARGCIAPGCGIAVGGRCYFPAEEGFLVYDGERCEPIGWEKIDRTWWASIQAADLALMSVARDYESRTLWFHHPASGRAWVYNYQTDQWTTVPLTADWIFSMLPIAESMDSGSLAAANMDLAPQATLNMDSLSPSGANETLSVIDGTQKVATLDGDLSASAHVRTARFVADDAGRRSLLRSVRPYTDNAGGTLSVAVRGYLRPDDADKAIAYKAPTGSGLAAMRESGRFHELDILFGGDQDVVGFDVVLSPQGVR